MWVNVTEVVYTGTRTEGNVLVRELDLGPRRKEYKRKSIVMRIIR